MLSPVLCSDSLCWFLTGHSLGMGSSAPQFIPLSQEMASRAPQLPGCTVASKPHWGATVWLGPVLMAQGWHPVTVGIVDVHSICTSLLQPQHPWSHGLYLPLSDKQ